MKAEDSQGFKREQLKNSQKSKKKRKEENETEFRKKNLENAKKSQQKQKDKNLPNYNEKHSKAVQKHQLKRISETKEEERIRRFNYANLFGPIFICSCCYRRLFENGVTKITLNSKIRSIERMTASTTLA